MKEAIARVISEMIGPKVLFGMMLVLTLTTSGLAGSRLIKQFPSVIGANENGRDPAVEGAVIESFEDDPDDPIDDVSEPAADLSQTPTPTPQSLNPLDDPSTLTPAFPPANPLISPAMANPSQSDPNRCLITLWGRQYDVTTLRSTHSGGDVFNCGTDMTDSYQRRHGTDLNRMRNYLVSGSEAGSPPSGAASKKNRWDDDNDEEKEEREEEKRTSDKEKKDKKKKSEKEASDKNSSDNSSEQRTFHLSELSQYDGTDPKKPIYLAFEGLVYDVTAGREFYVPGGPYHDLAGKDSTAALRIAGGEIIKSKYPVVGNLTP